MRKVLAAVTAACLSAATLVPAWADPTAGQQVEQKEAQIPVCTHKLGSVAVVEPDHDWWSEYHLGSPEALIKIFVSRSQCFTLVDRGKGFAALQRERDIAASGELRQGSNVGRGQVKAADYVLVPDIISKNNNASGSAVTGLIGGLVGGFGGALIAGINIQDKTADVVLTLTDVRSSEQVALEEGHAKKTDVSFGGGAGGGGWAGFGALGAGSYANTEIGQVLTQAYLDAYAKLVDQLGGLPGANGSSASQDNAQQAVSMTKTARMYERAGGKGKVIRTVTAGMLLYPTGNKDGVWWEVKDELGNTGWVSSVTFQLAK